jgi:hypothetical protein
MARSALLLRFVLSAAIGVGGSVGIGALLGPGALVSTARNVPATPVALTGTSGAPLDFGLRAASTAPVPLPPLPPTATIQLASAQSSGPSGPRAQWWNPDVPRVPPITQFDGGPLQAYNCTMAAGAMLARLTFGIVTTGSQLRALSGVPSGGTSVNDLENAINRGWNVRFFKGQLTPLQLRALLYGGAGAEVAVDYSEIPVALRIQKNFLGGHAIYLDGFRPAGPAGPAAYYVMDPIGRPWTGYTGDWWPADVLENAGVHHGGGLIRSGWGFPGGKVPSDHPILPPSAYPPTGPFPTPSPTASPTATPLGSASPSPSGSPGATSSPVSTFRPPLFDPMPLGDLEINGDATVGTPPPDVPALPPVNIDIGAFEVSPTLPCTGQPPGAGCPSGIIGVIDLSGEATSTGSSPPLSPIDFLYANAIAPGTYQFVFEAPQNTQASLWLWPAGTSGGTLKEATAEPAVLNGQAVWVATVTLDPTADYSFLATSSGQGVQAMSPVGSLAVSS